jgi:transglutaminase-like putative cysteine protease
MPEPTTDAARRVQCELRYQVTVPATVVAQVAVARLDGARITENLEITGPDGALPVTELADPPGGGRQHLVEAPPGPLGIRYRAEVTPDRAPPPPVTPLARVIALRPSRYCPSDLLAGFAARTFGGYRTPLARVQSITDYVAQNLTYTAGSSDANTDAVRTLLRSEGVCRDYAHLVATLCRAVGVPARVAAVYAPGLSPMDFHLVVEAEIDNAWCVWDATRLAPRSGLLRIATGRDAADVAFMTVLSGGIQPIDMSIMAVIDGELPRDDHHGPVQLR